MRLPVGLVLASLIFVTGCPPSDQRSSPSPAGSASGSGQGSCSKVGQSCEVSPGKLGTCVQKDDCKEAAGCFVCQSQH